MPADPSFHQIKYNSASGSCSGKRENLRHEMSFNFHELIERSTRRNLLMKFVIEYNRYQIICPLRSNSIIHDHMSTCYVSEYKNCAHKYFVWFHVELGNIVII
jgi:hypothetical protein